MSAGPASVSTSRDSIPEMATRITKEGRKLTYQLTVIQQPERARACGSGAKSSADRRPVDPPPVVELRIFEGHDAKKDITFSYNANFFLYATLESARQIIHGRVPAAAQQVPVLTGMPVSGMAYLDRPSEAGYFIFPDLSVRHEGKYRLSFNLYEETKDEKDFDDQPQESPSRSAEGLDAGGSFDWRLEVKSVPFTVYSAKKFPGLAESTVLSRTVAEQGCRVRIRRDVRMRRRDGKGGDEYDGMEDEYARARRTATPVDLVHDAYARPRSLSNASTDRQAHPQDRRISSVEMAPQYPPGYGPPLIGAQAAPGGYLGFGNSTHYQAPQYAQPQPPARVAPPVSHMDRFGEGAAVGHPSNHQPGFYHESQPVAPQYVQQRESNEQEYRRASMGLAGTSAHSGLHQNKEQGFHRAQTYSAYPPRVHTPVGQPPLALAPLKMPPSVESKLASLSSPTTTHPFGNHPTLTPQLPSPHHQERSSAYPSYNALALVPEAYRNGKRSYDSVFNSSAHAQPLHNGMRPTSSHHETGLGGFDEDDDCVNMEALRMSYKRADGSSYSRELPTLD